MVVEQWNSLSGLGLEIGLLQYLLLQSGEKRLWVLVVIFIWVDKILEKTLDTLPKKNILI